MESTIKYPKHSSVKFSMKPKTRSIGINTEGDYPNLNCPKCCQGNGNLKYFLVPCVPCYQMGPGNILYGSNLNVCASEKLNSSSSIPCKCDKPVHVLHCCPSVNCTSCDCNIKGINISCSSDSSTENTNIKQLGNHTLQTQISNDTYQKLETRLGTNEFYSPYLENVKDHLSEDDITRYSNEILGKKVVEDINNRHPKRTQDEKKLLKTLLTPNNGTTKYGTDNLTHEESDDCNESDNDEDAASVEDEEQFTPKVILTARKSCVNSALEPAQSELNNRSRSLESTIPNFINMGQNTGRPATAGGTNAEMLMMLKALVNQKGENSRLNQLLTQIGTENATKSSEFKKTVTGMPRKKVPCSDFQK